MESAYGIGVKNRYAVFLGEEEEDPLEILSKREEEVRRSVAAVPILDVKATHATIGLKDNKTKTAGIITGQNTKSGINTPKQQTLTTNNGVAKSRKSDAKQVEGSLNAKNRDTNKSGLHHFRITSKTVPFIPFIVFVFIECQYL